MTNGHFEQGRWVEEPEERAAAPQVQAQVLEIKVKVDTSELVAAQEKILIMGRDLERASELFAWIAHISTRVANNQPVRCGFLTRLKRLVFGRPGQ
nr:hypothetical protein [uncultured Methanoregula sp.]